MRRKYIDRGSLIVGISHSAKESIAFTFTLDQIAEVQCHTHL